MNKRKGPTPKRKPKNTMDGNLWVESDRGLLDDEHFITVHVGPDESFPLHGGQARDYALRLIAVVQRASYEAAVMRQLRSVSGLGNEHLGIMLSEFRKNLPAFNPSTLPLTWDYVLATRPPNNPDARNFVGVAIASIKGQAIFQVDAKGALEHAYAVLGAAAVIGLDDLYHDVLVKEFGLASDNAHNVVGSLVDFRKDGEW